MAVAIGDPLAVGRPLRVEGLDALGRQPLDAVGAGIAQQAGLRVVAQEQADAAVGHAIRLDPVADEDQGVGRARTEVDAALAPGRGQRDGGAALQLPVDEHQLALDHHGQLVAAAGDGQFAGVAADGGELLRIAHHVGGDGHRQLAQLLGGGLQDPQPVAGLADDARAVPADAGVADALLAEVGQARRGAVGGAPPDVEGAGLVTLAAPVDGAIGAEHGVGVVAGALGDPLRRLAGLQLPDVRLVGAAVAHAAEALGADAQQIHVPVGMDHHLAGEEVELAQRGAAADGDALDLVADGVLPGPVAGEQDLLPIPAEGLGHVAHRRVGQPRRPAAPGGHEVDVEAALAVGGEGDPLAIGREDRVAVVGRVRGQALGPAAGGGHAPQVPLGGEHHDLAVGGDGRAAGEGGGLGHRHRGGEQGREQATDEDDGSHGISLSRAARGRRAVRRAGGTGRIRHGTKFVTG